MAESSEVVANAQALASEYNNLRKDVLDVTLGHDHTGVAGHGKVLDIVVLKSADETVNNSDTLQSDDELLFAVGANEVWTADITLMVEAVSGAPDIKYGLSYPVGCTIKWGFLPYTDIFGGDPAGRFWTATSPGDNRYALPDETDVTTVIDATIDGITGSVLRLLIVNGVNAGNVGLKWAQRTAYGSDLTVKENSYLIARKLG